MNNRDFLDCLKDSFVKFLETHSRSNEKLKILHGAVAADLAERLGQEYTVQSLGYGKGKEGKISGRYIDKNVDIVVFRNNQPVAGIAVKFVMQNYAQNANNYFENMLGETANIRSRRVPYFQILIIPSRLPYYKNSGQFSKWENFSVHHIKKYRILSEDDYSVWAHTPDKMLLYVLDLPKIPNPADKEGYVREYLEYKSSGSLNLTETPSNETFGSGVIYNNYETFMQKIVHRILSE